MEKRDRVGAEKQAAGKGWASELGSEARAEQSETEESDDKFGRTVVRVGFRRLWRTCSASEGSLNFTRTETSPGLVNCARIYDIRYSGRLFQVDFRVPPYCRVSLCH